MDDQPSPDAAPSEAPSEPTTVVSATAARAPQRDMSGVSGITGFHAMVDVLDIIPVPFVGDTIVGVVNAGMFFKALFSGHFLTAIMILIIGGIDFLIGGLLDFIPGFGTILDLSLPSTCISAMLLAQAQSSRKERETGRRQPEHSFFADSNGNPTFLAVYWLLISFTLPIYGLWTGDAWVIVAGVTAVALFFLVENFRREFTSIYGTTFLVTLGMHLFMHVGLVGGYGYIFNTSSVLLHIGLYAAVTVGYLLAARDSREVKVSIMASVFAILVYSLPSLVQANVGNATVNSATIFFVTFLPVWPLFMLHRLAHEYSHGYAAKLLRSYVNVLVVVLLILGVGALWQMAGAFPQFSSPNVNVQGGVGDFGDYIVEKFKGVFTGFKQLYTRSQDPQQFYRGRVEENKDVPLGVEIESLRPSAERVSNGTEVVVYGNVRARTIEKNSFLKPEVTIIPSCVIERKDAPAADVWPDQMDIVWGTFGQFQCTFPPLGKQGRYTITGGATFPFQTWAYIDYTFIDKERAQNFALQGLTPHEELGIDEDPISEYTSGPVQLGMGGTFQPIVLHVDEPDIVPPGVTVGFTLASKWRGGEINRVESLELKVPKPFTLDGCDHDHEPPEQDLNDEDYVSYTFKNPQLDVVTLFTSVTCRLKLDDRDAALKLVSVDKATRSFVAVATYEYTVEETTTVLVR